MRVKVNLDNILAYGLDTLTGNSRADLLAAAARAEELGEDLYVQIPDVEGGDTEAPTERNTFEHYSDLPDPDGSTHEQQSVNLVEQKDYTDFAVIEQAIRSGMAPFGQEDEFVIQVSDDMFHDKIEVRVWDRDRPLSVAQFNLDRLELQKSHAKDALHALGAKFFQHFRSRQIVPDGHVRLGEE